MAALDQYLAAAARKNTLTSYASATRHFEQEWGGLLPATADQIARYLADFAGTLSNNTLRHRLAALGRWHAQHGFPDPTKAEIVRQAFKGIRAIHASQEKQATPLQLVDLELVIAHCEKALAQARRDGNVGLERQALRDRAMLLLGFWRGLRSTELVSLRVEHTTLKPGESVTLFFPTSKGDRQNAGRSFSAPALSRLCPVQALEAWLAATQLTHGPVFRRITRWGTLGKAGMNSDSIIPWLRKLLANAGVSEARAFSSHSLRRGLAGWATQHGWDLKTLMRYVGWRDVQSAARYIDGLTDDRARIESGLGQSSPRRDVSPPVVPASSPSGISLELTLRISSLTGKTRGIAGTRRHIEEICLAKYGGQKFGRDGTRYQVQLPAETDRTLDEQVGDLLDELHQLSSNNDCYLEASLKDPASGRCWD